MSEYAESYSQAEIVRLLKSLSLNMGELRSEVHALGSMFVTRAELSAWQTAYDREQKQLHIDLTESKAAAAPVKVSGWTIASFGVAAIVGLGSLLGIAITLMTVLK